MRGYMTMDQAFKCGDDDFPFIEGGYNDVPCSHRETKRTLSNYQSLGLSAAEILSDKWQVKTAEPVVLSAEEFAEQRTSGTLHNLCKVSFDTFRGLLIEFFNAGKEQGRLERDLELRSVINAAHALFFVGGSQYVSKEPQNLYVALGNIKPLNQDKPCQE